MGPDRGDMGGVPKLQCSFLQETDKYLGLCEQERYHDGAPMRWLSKGSASCHALILQDAEEASLPMESSSQIILTVSRRSARTSCFTQSMLLSVLLVSPACQTFDRRHILLDPLGIVCAI